LRIANLNTAHSDQWVTSTYSSI